MQPSQKQMARDQRLATLYGKGMSCPKIGALVGMTATGVYLALKRNGVATRGPGHPRGFRDANRANEMAALYTSGQTMQEVGDHFGVSRQYVEQVLRKLGVPQRSGGVSTRILLSLDKFRAKRDARDARLFKKWGLSAAEYDALVATYGASTTGTSPLKRFMEQRGTAGTRGVAWEITFKEWWTIWQESGHWEQRGRGYGYVMARYGDSGPYSAGNVQIITQAQNSSDSYLVKPGRERAAKGAITKARREADRMAA